MSSIRLNLVVAVCNNNGIGKNGELPWRLKKDMAFFKKITSETKIAGNQNAVIMGRKTWFSIPEKFRPLKGRVNIVLSRELKDVPEGVHIARSLPDAIRLVTSKTLETEIENIHIIGGSSVYKEAMTGPYDCRLFLTRIFKDFDCDTFLPAIDDTKFLKVNNPEDVLQEIQTENDIDFKFEVYDKVEFPCGQQALPVSSTHNDHNVNSPNCAGKKHTDLSSNHKEKKGAGFPFSFNIMAAMCHGNRGIGNGPNLPWPPLSEDIKWYQRLTSTPRKPNEMTGNKKIIHINGKKTFLSVKRLEMGLPNVAYVTISKTLKESNYGHPKILKIVETFTEAIDHCKKMWSRDEVDSVWIMGGQSVYQDAVNHQNCDKLYLTHVYTDFASDVFFPAFETQFIEIREGDPESKLHKDNNVQYEFKVHRRIRDS